MSIARDLLTRWPALDVARKRAHLQRSWRCAPGELEKAFEGASASAAAAARLLWQRDPSAWSPDATVQRAISGRLGWLGSAALMADSLPRLHAFAASIKDAGFTDVVLLGMGGSSLAPEVLRAVLGVAAGWPQFHMIDSTDPAAVQAVHTAPERTLYVFASKSGTTIEPNALAAHFRQCLVDAGVARWADHFVAITDEGTALASRARAEGFRDIFINPSDIGGRYSALSYFGLVPAALMGHDIAAILGWGLAMLSLFEPEGGSIPAEPATALGLALATSAQAGRDKMTLVMLPALEPFGLWIEQLVAESTGKLGAGVVPVSGEPLGAPTAYGSDRLFVRLRLHGSFAEEERDARVAALKATGAPVVDLEIAEPAALGAEFMRWEIATAIAGALLRINPFDEPNVQQAKDATRVLLDCYAADGHLPAATADLTTSEGVTLTLSQAARTPLAPQGPEAFLTLLQPGDYFAMLAYLGPDRDVLEACTILRDRVRERTRVATMFGYGPRYLHSTGQLHKGGPNTGVFLLVTATPRTDLPVPGEVFSFTTLELAQARGDFASLDATGRRALHVHLPAPDPAAIHALTDSLLLRLSASALNQH